MLCGSVERRTIVGGTDRLYGTTDDHFFVVKCRGCGLMQLYPQPAPEDLGRYYPPSYWFEPRGTLAEKLEESYRRFVLSDHVSFVQRAIRDSGESGFVLDVGCGGGLFLSMLSERGYRVIGLDNSPDAGRIAWRPNRVPVGCADLSSAPLEPSSCAAVTMFHVLEHLPDPGAYLESAHRLLRADGRLIVQVPNAACWQFLIFGSAWNGVDIPRHLTDFRASDLHRLLDRFGFEVLRTKHFSLRDNPAGLATTLAPGLDPMARRIRGGNAGAAMGNLFKDLLYFGLTVASVPFTVVEAACGAGSTVMVEARKKK